MVAAWTTWRLVSVLVALNSSDAAAMVCTFAEASSEAVTTVATLRVLCSAVFDKPAEVVSICSDAALKASNPAPIPPSKVLV